MDVDVLFSRRARGSMNIGKRVLPLMALGFFAAPAVLMAQSKIQCFESVDGSWRATEQWRNTLGRDRADGWCRQNLVTKGGPPSESMSFNTLDETVHAALLRWAFNAGYSLEWHANTSANIELQKGSFQAENFIQALDETLTALNKKLSSQQVEAVVFKDRVIHIINK